MSEITQERIDRLWKQVLSIRFELDTENIDSEIRSFLQELKQLKDDGTFHVWNDYIRTLERNSSKIAAQGKSEEIQTEFGLNRKAIHYLKQSLHNLITRPTPLDEEEFNAGIETAKSNLESARYRDIKDAKAQPNFELRERNRAIHPSQCKRSGYSIKPNHQPTEKDFWDDQEANKPRVLRIERKPPIEPPGKTEAEKVARLRTETQSETERG